MPTDPTMVPCRVEGCTRRHREDYAMCRPHWWRVPADLRARVYALYRSHPGSRAHLDALREAWEMAGRAT